MMRAMLVQDAAHPINEGWEIPVGVVETVLTRSAI
jgi:hypothetical protein